MRAIDDEDGRTRGWICEVRFVQESLTFNKIKAFKSRAVEKPR